MTNIDKYGELIDSKKNDTELIKCAHCDGSGTCKNLKTESGEVTSCSTCQDAANAYSYEIVPCSICGGLGKILTANLHKFTCLGCGSYATSKNGYFCSKCNAFVHTKCLKRGKIYKTKKGGLFASKIDYYERECPICNTPLAPH